MSRRHFLVGCAACAGAFGLVPGRLAWGAGRPKTQMRIRVVYSLHQEQQAGPDWPNQGFDFRPVMQRFNDTLAKRCRNFEFVTSLATGEEQARQILEADVAAGGIDGYVVFQMNCWNRVVQTLATSGKPTLYADFQFGGSGGFLVYNA
ncbi:MAG: twin-arginine translocation signal domain-containing protein, partial [Limisphaerales bacterium]